VYLQYSFPHSFSSTLVNYKSIELLTESGEVAYYYIQRYRHHSESGRAGVKFASGTSENFLTAAMLKVHLWPFYLC